MSKYFNRITALIIGIGFSQLAGCADVVESGPEGTHSATIVDCAAKSQPERGPLGELSCELGLSVRAADPALKNELRQALGSYAHALQRGDAGAVEQIISAELRARIEDRGASKDFGSNLQSFVDSEQRKLVRSVGSPSPSLTVTSAEVLADGSIAAIEFAIHGQPVPRPFYFVKEDGSYKLNVVQPDFGIESSSTYVVKNDDPTNRSFSCTNSGTRSVGPLGQVNVTCLDSCTGFFDGTHFTVNGSVAACDYNTFGIDMNIRNGLPFCVGYC